jgi:hypothetical protein
MEAFDMELEPPPDSDKVLTASHLESFLERRQGLKSFRIGFDDCCWDPVKRMTRSGKAFQPLATQEHLEKFVGVFLVFADVTALTSILRPSLQVLRLDLLTLGEPVNPWPESATDSLVSAIATLTNLIQLSLRYNFLHDRHLEFLLCNLSHLRSLALTGTLGDFPEIGSNLTDEGLEIIARLCPELQSLDVNYQYKASSRGVEVILRSCQHLRELRISRLQVGVQELPQLLSLSSTLLLLEWGDIPGRGGRGGNQEEPFLKEAIIATGGRTLILACFTGPVEVSGLPQACRQQQARSKQLIEEADEKRRQDPSVYNEWEFLFGSE